MNLPRPAAQPAPLLRPLVATDLPAVLEIQLACYGAGFVEEAALIARRLSVAPRTAWAAEHAGRVRAYLMAYPSRRGQLTALHGEFEPAAQPDTLYLHDLAVHPRSHGLRLGPRLVEHALAWGRANGWAHAALVSVQDSLGFWRRHGFAEAPLGQAEQRARFATYPGPALYMLRSPAPPDAAHENGA